MSEVCVMLSGYRQGNMIMGFLNGKTVTLIGGSGFIGRALVENLARAGSRILVLGRNSERVKRMKPLGSVGQITAVAGDATDESTLRTAIAPADIVINLVGILSPSGRYDFELMHASLPDKIAAIARDENVDKLIHFSALGADLKSRSIYASTKAEGERAVLRQFKKAIILRPSVVFGPGDNFFNRFGQMAMIAPALPLIGGGKNKMQPVFVGDVADAVMTVLCPDFSGDQIFELGGPRVYSFAELMQLTLKAVGRRRLLLPVPFPVMALPAFVAGFLPNPPLTLDQLELLKTDNVCRAKASGFAELGLTPRAAEMIVSGYLAPFRPGGRFVAKRQ